MTKSFAWFLFISSLVAFILQFRTQQLVVAADQLGHEYERPTPLRHDIWQSADASDLTSH